MNIELRPEEENDFYAVENLTREAFWNLYRPGCYEHLLMHNLRKSEQFVKELDFVALQGNEIIGNIAYAKAKITDNDKQHVVLTFGPLSVSPAHQKKGIGSQLINHTIGLARKLSYKAIVIYGNPEYYKRFGFLPSRHYNITDMDGNSPDYLMALELFPQAMKGTEGKFHEGDAYHIDKNMLDEFDKGFPPKEKLVLPTQIFKE